MLVSNQSQKCKNFCQTVIKVEKSSLSKFFGLVTLLLAIFGVNLNGFGFIMKFCDILIPIFKV
jgi:hypothetical protein